MSAREPLAAEPLELVALSLAYFGSSDSIVGDLIPQATWDSLFDRELVKLAAPYGGDVETYATKAGLDYLSEGVSALVSA